MAFSFRKMFSNISYFKRPDENDFSESEAASSEAGSKKRRHSSFMESPDRPSRSESNFEKAELDMSTRRFASSVKKIPEPVRYFSATTANLSDTALLHTEHNLSLNAKKSRKAKKLRLDIEKANKTSIDNLTVNDTNQYANIPFENTPKQISLAAESADIFTELKLREKDLFDKSFEMFDSITSGVPSSFGDDKNLDIESLSESESDVSVDEKESSLDISDVKMCWKVNNESQKKTIRSTSLESFSDVESDRNEDERITLLLSYQMKLEKIERLLKKLLTEFQFHIEVSKVFHCKSLLTTLPGSDVSNLPKILGEITHINSVSRGESPSWNIVVEKEDTLTKLKLKKQLLSMKHFIEEFVDVYLLDTKKSDALALTEIPHFSNASLNKESDFTDSIEIDLLKVKKNKENIPKPKKHEQKLKKKLRINKHKRQRCINEFPDWKEVLENLFTLDHEKLQTRVNTSVSAQNVTVLLSDIEEETSKCTCKCIYHAKHSSVSQKSDDSGLNKDEKSFSNTISSSIGDFTLDNSTLTAYSESLDHIISYNSFNDSSLINSMLQKSAIERIRFYVQVHSIQMRENVDMSFNSSVGLKSSILFTCQPCVEDMTDESELVKHILTQKHCEKIHFLYKTAYMRKCFSTGAEMKPSTVLNPMTMYRDDNKIVCFGDGKFACSLCFENPIMGESILMTHCANPDHVEKRDLLDEIFE